MSETKQIDPRQLSYEQLEAQNAIREIWNRLTQLPEIHPRVPIVQPSVSVIDPKQISREEPPLTELEAGRLIAIKTSGTHHTNVNLIQLKKDATLYEYVKNISPKNARIDHDYESQVLPEPVEIEDWDFGIKITQGVGRDWLYPLQSTQFYALPDDLAEDAWDLYKEVAGKKALTVRR